MSRLGNGELASYVDKLKSGQEGAFDVIYNETSDELYGLIYSFTKNNDDSFDLMQETYIQVTNKIGTLKDSNSFRTWMKTIALNKCRRYYQKNKKEILLSEEGQGVFESQFEENEEFLPQEILDSKEKQKIIKDIIDNLPVDQKTAIYLYYFNELSLSEVAKEMECSEGTVKSRLNYARKKIKGEVDTWEKKGTKLYGITGLPLLLLLLRNQLAEEKVPVEEAKTLLENIKNTIDFNQIGDLGLNQGTQNSGTKNADNFNNSGDRYSNVNSSKASEAINQTVNAAKITTGVKLAIAGVATVAVIGSMAFMYNQYSKNNKSEGQVVSSDNKEVQGSDNEQNQVHNEKSEAAISKNTEITLSPEELEAKLHDLEMREEIYWMYQSSLDLYRDAKTKSFLGKKNFNVSEISNAIGISKNGNFAGWAELNWSDTVISSYRNEVKTILKYKNKLKDAQDFTPEEKEAIEINDKMITYFCFDQEFQSILDGLNEKFELINNYDISKQEKSNYEMNKLSKEVAKENSETFAEYKENLNNLKKIMETN